jgi:single-strand DNA-binding protein
MVNKVILIGNVGADPTVRYLEGGVPVASFSLATSETYKNKNGERVEQTEWHNIVLWRGLAQIAEYYVKKGSQLYIEGKIRSRSWEDKSGIKHFLTEIYADTMQILARKKENTNETAPATTPDATTAPASTGTVAPREETVTPREVPESPHPPVTNTEEADDDLPF